MQREFNSPDQHIDSLLFNLNLNGLTWYIHRAFSLTHQAGLSPTLPVDQIRLEAFSCFSMRCIITQA